MFLTVEIDFHSLHSEQIKHKETLPGGKEKKKKKGNLVELEKEFWSSMKVSMGTFGYDLLHARSFAYCLNSVFSLDLLLKRGKRDLSVGFI